MKTVEGGVEVTGPWRQSEPTDRSDEAIFWYTWGWEERAVFAAPVKAAADASQPVTVTISGQACTDTSCSMIDGVTLTLAPDAIAALGEGEFEYDALSALKVSEDAVD